MRRSGDDNCRQNAIVTKQRQKGTRRRWIVRTLFGVAVAMVAGLGVLCMVVHHVPGWYQSVYVPEVRLDEVRADATRSYSRFGDGLARRKTFEFTLDEHQVSEWIAARERIWPESGGWVPPWVNDPLVRFQEQRILVGARVDLDGHQLIAGAYLSIEVGSDDILVVRLERVTVGSLPVPLGLLARPLARLLRMEGHDLDFVPAPLADTAQYFRDSEAAAALSEGVRRANRFIWENGRRPYRIEDIRIGDGKLTLTIEPL